MSFHKSLGGMRGLMPDNRIKELIKKEQMITDIPEPTNLGLSHGTSSYGFDATLAPELMFFRNNSDNSVVIDPKNFDNAKKEAELEICFYEDDCIALPPHSFVLGRTNETFKIPNNVLSICMGKSSYARCGLIVNVTPLEPGWIGQVTLEISNTTPMPVKVYFNEGICQFLFFENLACDVDYVSKNGKYQNQEGIVTPLTTDQ